ncbi:MAG: uroporphyrinogen-III synthase [Acidobacteria bacterium]|nr:uroporphyrinogen-III synthase [Acidobacteriota bacterium]
MTSVLVVRKYDDFSRILTEHGFSVLNCPTIETSELDNLPDLAAKISANNYDGIFLTSARAAAIAVREVFDKKPVFPGRVYVLGNSSRELLKDRRLDLFFDEKANTAREMLVAIPPDELRGRRFLFIRGEKSLGAVTEFLKQTAAVDEAVVYRTVGLTIDDASKREIAEKTRAGEIAAACFFSPSGAESFLEQLGAEILRKTKIAAIGRTTANFFAGRGLKTDLTAGKATAGDFAADLIKYLKKKGRPF